MPLLSLQHHASPPLLQQPSHLSSEGLWDTKSTRLTPGTLSCGPASSLSCTAPCRMRPHLWDPGPLPTPSCLFPPQWCSGLDPPAHTQVPGRVGLFFSVRVTCESYCHLVAETRDAKSLQCTERAHPSKYAIDPSIKKHCAPQVKNELLTFCGGSRQHGVREGLGPCPATYWPCDWFPSLFPHCSVG